MSANLPPRRGLPFGLAASQPVFDRATDMAVAMFDGYAAALAIVHQGRMWRTRDPEGRLPKTSVLAERVISSGAPLWVEDLTEHPVSAGHPLVAGGGHLRFYVGVPIRCRDGQVIGVLSVLGLHPKPFDAAKLRMLGQLAEFVADECFRQLGALELEETQSALSAFVKAVPASVMVSDREMRVLQASPTWLDAFDLTLEEARGRSIYEIAPAFFETFRRAYERCLAGERVHADRVPSPGTNDAVRFLRAELTPWHDSRGEIGGIIVAALDITEMVEALERTARSEQRLKLAVEIADLHVWEIDYTKMTLETDGAAETFFDQDVDTNAFIRDTSITIDPRDRARIGDEWTYAVGHDLPFRPEYRINRLDGKEVWANCTVKLVRDARGNPARLIGAMQNITERKLSEALLLQAKEEAEAANRAKSNFLATISHEIRTPLNGVLGMAQVMAAEDLSPAQRERLGVIRQSGETLLTILNDVLDLSKIEAGKLDLEMAEFDLAGLVGGAQDAFSGVAERKAIDLALVISPEARGRYRSDPTRLRQILYNLVSNALKFTDAGEVRLAVTRAQEDLVIEVSDTGLGMSAEVMGRLFQKFEQADASTTRRFGGTGLGLAICRQLAELLGGAITVTSAEGRGSTFRVVLPLERIGEETVEAAPAETTGVATLEPERALRVLAAEDNSVNQLVLKTLLQQVGVEVFVVGDGQQALEAWRAHDWDLILMDVQMPVMDGPSATVAIRADEARSGRARTPIIALTANAMAHQTAEYLAVGMDGFVAKPIDAAKLFQAIAEAIEAGDQQAECVAVC
ncbi:ATP-binding protein [Phenylobacterium sp.]|uniref:ATP-binding protein n=1 Tax=Phenylobacterium sp. TaxID=1871053 RepID=UPI002737BFDC|nr:ATP-binding protein [Phenylobacterium sp.]MDP3868325.1 ATP-binding protein [Phenylobacterium sp.]